MQPANTQERTAQQRIPSLDGLRGIAILMVIFSHVLQTYHWNQTVPFVWRLVPGATGVTIFFVLSGYLISKLLLREHSQHGSIRVTEFYRRRLYRIAPAYLVYIAFIALLAGFNVVSADWQHLVTALAFAANYVQMPWVLGHTWSLSVEQQFYLLYPLLLAWGLRRQSKRALVYVLIATVLIPILVRWLNQVLAVWPFDATYSFEGRVDALAFGCLCAIVQQRAKLHPHSNLQRHLQRWALPIAAALVVTAVALPVGTARTLLHNTLLGLATALALHASTLQPDLWLARALNAAPLRAIGLISYSLYLWQQLWMTPALQIALPWALMGALATGAASYWLVEKPALRLRQPSV